MLYDLIVLGGGPGGYLASERAAHAGLSVLCIEKNNVGGVCLNEGCVPTKALLYSAKLYDGAKQGEKYGVKAEGLTVDHTKVLARKNKVVRTLVSGVKSTLKQKGVELLMGAGEIKGRDGADFFVEVNGESYMGKNLIIATGSSAAIPPIPGLKTQLASGFVLTNKEILELDVIPEKLVVIGGGVIGLEMASYFCSLGAQVTVVEMLDHIAGENDGELTAILQRNYEKKGIRFLLGARVVELVPEGVRYELNGEAQLAQADKVLLSIGRRANIEGIGLESLGVATERGAILCDAQLRTNIPGVYAVGDVNAKSMLAHTAYREAETAVNAILGVEDEVRYDRIPAVIYTNPELGAVGLTEAQAQAQGLDFTVVKLSMRYSGRYVAENEGGDGMCKLLVDQKSRQVLGAQALANYASEFIAAVAVMMEANMTVEQIRKVVFPHPTVAEILREAVWEVHD